MARRCCRDFTAAAPEAFSPPRFRHMLLPLPRCFLLRVLILRRQRQPPPVEPPSPQFAAAAA